MLKLNINYYTVIPMKLYDTIFSEQEVTQESDETAKVFAEVFTKDYISFLKDIKTKKELKRYITKVYPSLITNLSLKDKLNYLDSLWNTPLSNIDFELLPGKELNSGFSMDETRVSEQMEELTAY
jgi:hypothetical protein